MDMNNMQNQHSMTDAYRQLLNEVAAAPVAPARPATKPATAPAKPATAPNRNPFKIPAPAVKPRPQNRSPEKPKEFETDGYVAESILREAYEDEAEPGHQRFWRDFSDWRGENVIGKHPVIRQHGQDLARGAFEKTSGDVQRHQATPPEVHRAFMLIQRIEASHKEQLEELAKDVCAQLWGPEIRPLLRAHLERPPSGGDDEEGGADQDQEELDREKASASDELVQKRVLSNFLTQGSAVHLMFTAHHLILDRLNAIDQRLPGLYSKFASGSAHGYWLMNLERIAGDLTNAVVGQARVEVDNDEEGQEGDQEGSQGPNFNIDGYGVMFPILVQELCKGVANYLSMAGVEGVGAEELTDLFNRVDNPVDEWYYIQVGHELWRRFLKAKPKDVSLAATLVALHKLPAEEQNKVIQACISNPEEAKELIAAITANPAEAEELIDDAVDDESWRESLDGEEEPEDWGQDDQDGGLMEPDEEEEDDTWWR